jgi:hypothetical protein
MNHTVDTFVAHSYAFALRTNPVTSRKWRLK